MLRFIVMGREGPLEAGLIYCDENLRRLSLLPNDCVDLIYLDPPFFSSRHYEVIWGDEAEVRSFEDRWQGGIHVYVSWMRDRAIEMQRVLREGGSLYLHCDTHASHYLKVMLDEVMGSTAFRSEVIWKRTSAHSSANRYGPVHDTILFYTKGKRYTWNHLYQDYDPNYVETFFDQQDADGRRWKRTDLTGSGTRNGATGQPWRGINVTQKGRHWAQPPEALDGLDAAGRVHWPAKRGGMPRLKQYPEDLPGVPLQDVWTDIRPLHNLAKERLGYPTQKPEELLERIILASSNVGDVVLDPFCGCGTTVAVAHQLGRRWLGIDISPTAVELMLRRMRRLGAHDVVARGLPTTLEDLKSLKPYEFQNWVINRLNATHSPRKSGDMGIDGYSFMLHDPIQVKQSERVGRNVVDNFETAIERAGKTKGYVIAFSYTSGAWDEVARARWNKSIDISLVLVRDLVGADTYRPAHLATLMPEPAQVTKLPLADTRMKEDKPTAEELIASDRAAS